MLLLLTASKGGRWRSAGGACSTNCLTDDCMMMSLAISRHIMFGMTLSLDLFLFYYFSFPSI